MTLLAQIYYGCFDIYVFSSDRWMIPMKVNQLHPDCGYKTQHSGFSSCLADSGGWEILKFDLILCISSKKRLHFVCFLKYIFDQRLAWHLGTTQRQMSLVWGPIYFQGSLGGFSWSSWNDFFFLLEGCIQLKVITNIVIKHLISVGKWSFTGIPVVGNSRE